MAFTQAQLEALKNSLLAGGQPITAAIHRSFAQKIIDELYDPQSRGNLLAGVQADGTTEVGDTILLIRGGQAYLAPASLFGGVGGTLAGLGDVVIVDPQDEDILTYDAVTEKWINIPLTGLFVTQAQLDAALDALQLPTGERLISAELILTSTTAGTITAQWVDFVDETESVTAQALAFNGTGLPPTGEVRFDIVQGANDGTASVKQGTSAIPASAVIPTADANNVILAVVLWSDAGEAEVSPPGGGNQAQTDFSLIRLNTLSAANTTGLYAKLMEVNLSKDGNYSLELAYAEPRNAVNFDGVGMQNLRLSFTVNGSRVIIASTVQVVTTEGTLDGDFVLYQITGNKAALYHKSSHYWGRIQYRILFQNSQISLANFTSNAPYAAAPGSPVATYSSVAETGGATTPPVANTYADRAAMIAAQGAQLSGYFYYDGLVLWQYLGTTAGTIADYRPITEEDDFTASTGSILFDVQRKYGFTTAVTGNLTVGVTGAKEKNVSKVLHNSATAPTVTGPGGVTIVKDGGTYAASVDNIIYFVCHKNDAGTVTKIAYTITSNQP